MEHLVSHCKIVAYGSEEAISNYYRFDLFALDPFDRMKIVLEQVLYANYLCHTTSGGSLVDDFRKMVEIYYKELPTDISSAIGGLRDLYHLGIENIGRILREGVFNFIDCYAIFSHPLTKEYDSKYYLGSMTQSFLEISANLATAYRDKERYPDDQMYDAAIYIPSAAVFTNYDHNVARSNNTDYQICFNLEAKPIPCFYLAEDHTPFFHDFSLWTMLAKSSLKEYTLDSLIGLIASFSVCHDNYVMNLDGRDTVVSIVDLCYDLVTGSSSTRGYAGSSIQRAVVDHARFNQLIKYLQENSQLRPLQEYELFGEILESTGADPKIVNYFVQPDEAITGEEAYAFNTSEYATFIKFPDRFKIGMEAADDPDTPEEDPAEIDTEETGNVEETATPEDMSESDPKADNRPEIDPDKMLLELAAPNETMADYIYREMVNRRITAILQNPPESARPNDLLMLKRWKSRWLYLTSIACLRDFLSRVSIRLSETVS